MGDVTKRRAQGVRAPENSSGVFKRNAQHAGQDALPNMRMSSNRLMVLGAIAHGPESGSAGIVRYLCSRGFDFMKVAHIYRIIRDLGDKGLILKDGQGKLSLTDLGERFCPDKEQFERLLEATRTMEEIGAAVRKR